MFSVMRKCKRLPSTTELDKSGLNEKQPTDVGQKCSPKTLLCCVGNMEYLATQISSLGTQLRKAPFLDVDARLSEIISSCESIVAAVQHVQHVAEEYTLQHSNDDVSLGTHIIENSYVEHDPGKQPTTLSDANRRHLIHLGPRQPKLSNFPKTADLKNKAQNRFSSSWYDEYPFLEYSISNDSAHCFVCSLFHFGIDRPKADDAWIKGTRKWHKIKGSQGRDKQGKLSQHFSSNKKQQCRISLISVNESATLRCYGTNKLD